VAVEPAETVDLAHVSVYLDARTDVA